MSQDHKTGVGTRVAADVSREHLWSTVKYLSEIDRPSGSNGENQAVDYTVDQLHMYGIDTQVYEFESFLSHPISASLEILEPEERVIECKTHSFSKSTGPGGVTAKLVDPGGPGVTEAKGKATLVDGLVSPNKVLAGVTAQAAAQIFCNPEDILHEMIVTTVWGTPTSDDMDRIPDLPVVSIRQSDAEYLRGLLEKGPVKVKVVTEVRTGWQTLRLPTAFIPGTESDKYVLVGGHIDSWHVGTTDNATGDASLLELARVFGAHQGELKRGVRVAWWPGHSTGRYSGSTWFADNQSVDLYSRAIAYFNIDSPGARNATEYVARHTSAELETFNVAMMEDLTGQDVPVQRPSRAADQSFANAGIPSVAAYSFIPLDHPDRRAYTGGSAGGKWWHNESDTLDKGDPDVLEFDTKLAAHIIGELATRPVLPFDFGTVVSDMEGGLAGLEPIADPLGFSMEPIREVLDEFCAAVTQLETVRDQLLTGENPPVRVEAFNDLLIRVSRNINPALVTREGPFAEDPADKVPMLYGEQKPVFPLLTALMALSEADVEVDAPGVYKPNAQDIKGFALTELVRERNRIVVSLIEATRLVRETLGGEAG